MLKVKFWLLLKVLSFFGLYAIQLALLVSLVPFLRGRWVTVFDSGEGKLLFGVTFLVAAVAQLVTAAWRARTEVYKASPASVTAAAVRRHLHGHQFLGMYLLLLGASATYWGALQVTGRVPPDETFAAASARALLLVATFAGPFFGSMIQSIGASDGTARQA